jgi:hypothetical protein
MPTAVYCWGKEGNRDPGQGARNPQQRKLVNQLSDLAA